MPNIVPCLWFDHQAEEAANFYVALFPNSRIGNDPDPARAQQIKKIDLWDLQAAHAGGPERPEEE